MISERKFAEKYTSFWGEFLPRGAAVSRFINLQVHRFAQPLRSKTAGHRRALINELGFRLFVQRVQEGQATDSDLAQVYEIARNVVQFLGKNLMSLDKCEELEPSTEEIEEATILAHRLARFFLSYEKKETIVIAPLFTGCGIIESCEGDVLAGSTLYEVKSGESGFRLTDLRQVVTYCALNHARPLHQIVSVGFLNPRMGVYFTSTIEALVRSATGMPSDSFFFDMTNFLVSQTASH